MMLDIAGNDETESPTAKEKNFSKKVTAINPSSEYRKKHQQRRKTIIAKLQKKKKKFLQLFFLHIVNNF